MLDSPRTWNDALLDEKSRSVFVKCLDKIEAALDAPQADAGYLSAERLHALAACADAAACGFKAEGEEEPGMVH